MEYESEFGFVNQYLTGDEYILWKGKPEKGGSFSPQNIGLLVFSIFWLGFSLFWESAIFSSDAPFIMKLFGLPFIAIGVYLLYNSLFRSKALRNKTFYVVTNKKLIIKADSNIRMYNAADLPPMQIQMHKNGNGTILFRNAFYAEPGRTHYSYFALENLSDVVKAQNAIDRMER